MDKTEALLLKNACVFDGIEYIGPDMSIFIRDGHIEAVGGDDDVRGKGREIDLEGAFVMPGITDSHIHVVSLGESTENVDLFECRSAEECAALIAERAAQTPAGKWIIARGWRKSLWRTDAFPTASVLDAKVPGHPVFSRSFDGHSVWVNSKAMELAGVGGETEDPSGGEIERDEHSGPSGVFKENAIGLVRSAIPEPSAEEQLESLLKAQAHLNQLGVGGVHDMNGMATYRAARRLAEEGRLTLRFGSCCAAGEEEEAGAARAEAAPDDMVRVLGVKLFADGSLNSQTAAMFEPYEGSDSRGIMTHSVEELTEQAARAAKHGLPAFIHAIGDRAVHEALNAVEAAGNPKPGGRIEHAAVTLKDDVSRMKSMGVHASMQPPHLITDIAVCDKYLPSRCNRAYVLREMLKAGVTLAFGSDAPVVPADPRHTLFAAIARKTLDGGPKGGWFPEQSLTIKETLSCCCLGPALSIGAGGVLGRVAPGCAADLSVFVENPLGTEPEALLELTVRMTIVGGRVVYEAG